MKNKTKFLAPLEPNQPRDGRSVGFQVAKAGSTEEAGLKENMELLEEW